MEPTKPEGWRESPVVSCLLLSPVSCRLLRVGSGVFGSFNLHGVFKLRSLRQRFLIRYLSLLSLTGKRARGQSSLKSQKVPPRRTGLVFVGCGALTPHGVRKSSSGWDPESSLFLLTQKQSSRRGAANKVLVIIPRCRLAGPPPRPSVVAFMARDTTMMKMLPSHRGTEGGR